MSKSFLGATEWEERKDMENRIKETQYFSQDPQVPWMTTVYLNGSANSTPQGNTAFSVSLILVLLFEVNIFLLSWICIIFYKTAHMNRIKSEAPRWMNDINKCLKYRGTCLLCNIEITELILYHDLIHTEQSLIKEESSLFLCENQHTIYHLHIALECAKKFSPVGSYLILATDAFFSSIPILRAVLCPAAKSRRR